MNELKLPNNVVAERNVIGGILIDNNLAAIAFDWLQPEDFFAPTNRKIFTAISDLYNQGKPIDFVTLASELEARKVFPSIGEAVVELSKLTDGSGHSTLLEEYAKLVKEAARLREIIVACHETQQRALESEDSEKLATDLESKLYAGRQEKQSSFSSLGDLSENLISKAIDRAQSEIGLLGIPSGFSSLDRYTDGFQPGQLIYLGASPSVGKTAFSLQIAYHAASQGFNVGYFSLEMSKQQLMGRILASQCRVEQRKIQKGWLSHEEWELIQMKRPEINQARMWIDDRGGISPGQIRAACKRMKQVSGLDMVVVDYLQLLGSNHSAHTKADDALRVQVAKNSAALKNLAKEFEVPVICLSQLSRAACQSEPQAHHLRESGNTEADADVIMLLWPEDEERTEINCKIAKNREGEIGVMKFYFERAFTRFFEKVNW